MGRAERIAFPAQDADALRLLAVSRIPRCKACPRLAALEEIYLGDARALAGPLPSVPPYCTHTVCRPLVDRIVRKAS